MTRLTHDMSTFDDQTNKQLTIKLGTPLLVGLLEGIDEGALEKLGSIDGCDEGRELKDGASEGCDDGLIVSVGTADG